MKLYRVTLKHDNGTTDVLIDANSIQHAKERIMEIEKCPERAIISVWRHVTTARSKSAAKPSDRKTIAGFIQEHRKEIDAVILRVVPNARLNNEERRKWILNDESLYNWARSEGVRI